MKIEVVNKTQDYILEKLLKEDLHFLVYREYPSKNGTTLIRTFASSSLNNMSINDIMKGIDDDKTILIRLIKEA